MIVCLAALLALVQVQEQGSWKELGGSATNGGLSSTPEYSGRISVIVDALGTPVAAYYGPAGISVRRWNGATWTGMGGTEASVALPDSGASPYGVSLALAAGNPIVAWADSSSRLNVRRWNATTQAWTPMDATNEATLIVSDAASTASNTSIAITSTGAPIVAWQDVSGGAVAEIYVRRWDAATNTWTTMDPAAPATLNASKTTAASVTPGIALDPSNNPVVVWQETVQYGRIFLKRWNGADWVEVGGSTSGGGLNNNYLLGTYLYPSVVVDASGAPIVAYADRNPGNYDVQVRRWNGTAWLGMDGTSATINVSSTPDPSSMPAMALDAAGWPVVAWTESTGGGAREIFARRWNGSQWAEIAGSATGGGISSTSGDSSRPSIAVWPGSLPVVAWEEPVDNVTQAYLRRWSPPPAPPAAPISLGQVNVPGSGSVAIGGTTDALACRFTAQVPYDPNGDSLRLEVELRSVGTSFTGSATAAGSLAPAGTTIRVDATGLADDVPFHWQLRSVDATGLASGWVTFGDNDETAADFRTPFNAAPITASIQQVAIWDRGVVSTLLIHATLTDANPGDRVMLEVEIRRVEEAFTGVPTSQTPLVANGSSVEIPVKLLDGIYKWRYQVRDDHGKPSGWTSYGGNSDSEPDFAFPPFGSSGKTNCTQSALPAVAAPALLLIGLIAFAARRN